MSFLPIPLPSKRPERCRPLAYAVRRRKKTDVQTRPTMEITIAATTAMGSGIKAGGRVRLDHDASTGCFRLTPILGSGGIAVSQCHSESKQLKVRLVWDDQIKELFPDEPIMTELQVCEVSRNDGLTFAFKKSGGHEA